LHSAPPDLPFVKGSRKDVKYIVVCRHPDEAIVSFKIFLEQHTDAFANAAVQPLETGSLVRKGKAGAAHEDGMTKELSAELRALGPNILTAPAPLRWLYEGGALP
jgi:hypothetical protein